jgi:hypothetical protein
MGITISYKGTLNNIGSVGKLVSEIKDICQIMKWKYVELDDDWRLPCDGSLVRTRNRLKIKGQLGLKGIGFQPHKDCEWVNLYFDKNGTVYTPEFKALDSKKIGETTVWNGVKTQFAPVNIHIAIVKLLRHLKNNYINDLYVYDDGGYWDSNDLEKLTSARDTIFGAMDMLACALNNIENEASESLSPEEFAEYIANILRDGYNKNVDSTGL